MQQNSKCSLYDDGDETINYISECSKLPQKEYKNRHDWTRRVIHWELCKKLKFDRTNKRYMLNTEFAQDNETDKLPWGFEIQTIT